MQLTGTVLRRHVAQGSKSERDALLLKTDTGEYILRRMGANAFLDPVLEKSVGRRVQCEGEIAGGYTFIATQVNPVG